MRRWRWRRTDEDFNAEIQASIAIDADRLMAEGMSSEEAGAAARRAFGNVTRAQERFYESRRLMWLDDLRRDTRHAIRFLLKNPGFAMAATLTLAVGVGANTAIFSVLHAVVLRPLPYPDSHTLVSVVENVPAAETATGRPQRLVGISTSDIGEWQTRSAAFSHIAVYLSSQMTLTTRTESVRVAGAQVSSELFAMLGAQTRLGRVFRAQAERADGEAVIVLSSVAWRTHFSEDPDIVGRTVTLDGKPYSVVGIMRPEFQFPSRETQFWVPFVPEAPRPGRCQ